MDKLMKRFGALTLAFMATIAMNSCSANETYSLKEVAGFEISEIASVQASESVYQSLSWPISKEAYSYLDRPYVKVDFDINATYFSTWPPSELKDDAYVLRAGTDAIEAGGLGGVTFIISHNTKYIYFDGLAGTYRSKDPAPSVFVDLIKAK